MITSLQEDVATSSKSTLALLLRHLLVPSKKRGTNEHDFLLSTRITTPPLVTIRSPPQSPLLPGPPLFLRLFLTLLETTNSGELRRFFTADCTVAHFPLKQEQTTPNSFALLLPLIITACSRSSPASFLCSAHTDCHNDKSAANAAVPAIAAFLWG
jgi:hypothetical protein